MAQQKKIPEFIIPAKIIAKVRENFARKSAEIVAHTKPWTPWGLAHLLEIDDSKSEVPYEAILYKALRGKGRHGIANRNPVVQVCACACMYVCLCVRVCEGARARVRLYVCVRLITYHKILFLHAC